MDPLWMKRGSRADAVGMSDGSIMDPYGSTRGRHPFCTHARSVVSLIRLGSYHHILWLFRILETYSFATISFLRCVLCSIYCFFQVPFSDLVQLCSSTNFSPFPLTFHQKQIMVSLLCNFSILNIQFLFFNCQNSL